MEQRNRRTEWNRGTKDQKGRERNRGKGIVDKNDRCIFGTLIYYFYRIFTDRHFVSLSFFVLHFCNNIINEL